MGNRLSLNQETGSENAYEFRNKMLFYLHRTWEVIITERWSRTRSRHSKRSDLSDVATEYSSRYSTCSCAQCQKDDGFSSACDSDLFDTISNMAPNSLDNLKMDKFPVIEEGISKEKQRPPIYNPEDYALSLKKWGRKAPNGVATPLYGSGAADTEGVRSASHVNFRDYRNPMLLSVGSEMTLRQFGTVSELLAKLKVDLKLAYPSFIQEFVSEPLDGVILLLDLLRAVQLSQSANPQAFPGSSHTTGKIPPAVQRRALLDELACLQCLFSCCSRYSEAVRRLTASSAGLFTLAICIMSNVNKSRMLALQLLTKVCEDSASGHAAVSEALSTLRLRFGEPVRFRFLVGMLNSTGGSGDLLVYGMRFLNAFLDSAPGSQRRLYVQAELEQAGFDVVNIKKNVLPNSDIAEKLFDELRHWEQNNIDVETMMKRIECAENENNNLRDKLLLLERKVQILQEEKVSLSSYGQCLKSQCTKLKHEVESLTSQKDITNKTDDEGISSSERSSSPEDEAKRQDLDEEETTIEEVMEELQNIINDAESENLREQRRNKEMEEAQVAAKLRMRVNPPDMDDSCLEEEGEIVPSKLNPQPPRKTRSLVHLFEPTADYASVHRELFFENETSCTSGSDSDSLLSASRRATTTTSRDHVVKVAIRAERAVSCARKSKSLDRIGDGLGSLVDIVVTDGVATPSVARSVSHVFVNAPPRRPADERQRMFLPAASRDAPFFFPRVQEKLGGGLTGRGQGNAGLYSGEVKRNAFACKGGGSGKVTDYPSGLY